MVYLALFLVVAWSVQAERFAAGELKGFTKGVGEHEITRAGKVVVLRKVQGKVVFAPDSSALEGALVELRGPGKSVRIWAATTDECGHFAFGNVPSGRYVYKITAAGYQSELGELVVSSKAQKSLGFTFRLMPAA